jgi:outer membrane protein OmpA-like peptidoglycan-associated protein/tetratricopeptide (TPR) repeat protein
MRSVKIILSLIILILTVNHTYSQSKTVEKANKLFERYAYDNSIRLYLKVIENNEKSTEIYANLADSYYHNADMENAVLWYDELMNYDLPVVKGEYYFKYSQALKAIGEYTKSDLWLERLAELNTNDSRASSLKYDPNYLEKIEAQSNRYSMKTVGVNSLLSDFATGFDNDGGVIFSSSRDEGVSRKITHKWTGLPFLQLYTATISKDGNLVNAQKLEGDFNTKYNESSVATTNDGNTMYFTRNSYDNGYQKDKTGIVRLKLYRAFRSGNYWTDIVELPFNSTEYSVAHPTLSADNTKLYFASDMPGTNGLSDIYVVDVNKDGSFSEPLNLGNQINTEGRDTFPFISKNGQLYFASDGHLGLGGLDVFVCTDLKTPSKDNIYNIGKPINSTKDDFAFIIDDETKTGYFTSNRYGGRGSDDIYKLVQIEDLKTTCEILVAGTVTNKNNGEIIAGARVVIYNAKSQTVKELNSDDFGKFNFELDCGEESFKAVGTKESFKQGTETFTIEGKDAEVKLALELEPEKVVAELGTDLAKLLDLNPIYFDFDKSFIRADARIELEKVIAYMQEYPSVKIDVRSHTDSRGRDSYNLALSKRRNKSTRQYIVDRGMDKNRLTGDGYGETQHLNLCSNGVKCSEEEHQLNRRSEFIVIEN